MIMATRKPVPAAQPADAIAELAAKLRSALEQNWSFHDVPPEERDALRPGALAQIDAIEAQLREDARTRGHQV